MARKDEKRRKERPPLKERPLFKWAKEHGLDVLDTVGEIAADITGIEALGNIIKKDPKFADLSPELQLEFERIERAERTALDAEITQRWISDNQTDSWLTKNVRPCTLVLWNVAAITMLILQGSGSGFHLDQTLWDEVFISTGAVNAAYFGFREWGKRNRSQAILGQRG